MAALDDLLKDARGKGLGLSEYLTSLAPSAGGVSGLEKALGTQLPGIGGNINRTGVRVKIDPFAERKRLEKSGKETDFTRAILGSLAQNYNPEIGGVDVAPGRFGFDKSREFSQLALQEAAEAPLLNPLSEATGLGLQPTQTRTGATLDTLESPGPQSLDRFGKSFSTPEFKGAISEAKGRRAQLIEGIKSSVTSEYLKPSDIDDALRSIRVDDNFEQHLNNFLSERAERNFFEAQGGPSSAKKFGEFAKTLAIAIPSFVFGGPIALAAMATPLLSEELKPVKQPYRRDFKSEKRIDFSDDVFNDFYTDDFNKKYPKRFRALGVL